MFALYHSYNITGISTDKSTSLCCSVKRESNCGGQDFVKLIVMELKDAKQTLLLLLIVVVVVFSYLLISKK